MLYQNHIHIYILCLHKNQRHIHTYIYIWYLNKPETYTYTYYMLVINKYDMQNLYLVWRPHKSYQQSKLGTPWPCNRTSSHEWESPFERNSPFPARSEYSVGSLFSCKPWRNWWNRWGRDRLRDRLSDCPLERSVFWRGSSRRCLRRGYNVSRTRCLRRFLAFAWSFSRGRWAVVNWWGNLYGLAWGR